MKIPSIKYVSDEAFKSAKRFPLTLICAFLGAGVAIYLTEYEEGIKNKFPLINLLLVSALGLVLFFCITIYLEKVRRSKLTFWLLNTLGAVVLLLVYISLPNAEDTSNINQPYIRYVVYNIVVHLLVSFAPFIGRDGINGFWQYNKMLFLRFCLSVLYSGFVYTGLALALGSIKVLFEVDIAGETFFELFILVIGVFNTWFFISGINSDIGALEEKEDYPKGLKVFTQYVLLPLLILYLIILYAYIFKIVGIWDWPKGIVSYLITCVAILGIFAFLLIYPFGKKEEHHWITKFSKVYYYTLIPLTAVLFIAIGIRIGDYGITVNRYVIVELGVWLTFISFYFVLGKKNIKLIPISLATLILFTSFGAWGMFSVSEKSQIKRLKSILMNSGILVNGKVVNEPKLKLGKDSLFYLDNKRTNERLVIDSVQNEVYSIINYMDDFHGFNGIDAWYKQNADSVFRILRDSSKFYNYGGEKKVRMELLGLGYKYHYNSTSKLQDSRTYNSRKNVRKILRTTGYDYVLNVSYSSKYKRHEDDKSKFFTFEDDSFVFSEITPTLFSLVKSPSDTLNFDLGSMIESLKNKYKDKSDVVVEELVLSDSTENLYGKMQLFQIHVNVSDSLMPNNFTGRIYLKLN